MLIRVRPDLFINTENIEAIYFASSGTVDNPIPSATVYMVNGHSGHEISRDAARFVCEMMEANTAAILPEDESEPEKPTLKAQIAQALRDTWKGATLGQIDAVFPDAGIPAIKKALAELEVEQVIVGIVRLIPGETTATATTLYYHASSSEARSTVAGQPSSALPRA